MRGADSTVVLNRVPLHGSWSQKPASSYSVPLVGWASPPCLGQEVVMQLSNEVKAAPGQSTSRV